MTSPLVPWNTCGAYMSGVLGVSTASYLRFCFFNLLSPVLDVIYGFLGFKVQELAPEDDSPPASTEELARAWSWTRRLRRARHRRRGDEGLGRSSARRAVWARSRASRAERRWPP